MRIGCLQFAPRVGDIEHNLNRADAVLSRANPDNLDLLVLPELAFSGHGFRSLRDISPFLEHSGSGISSLWSRTIALRYDCTVVTGYPEKAGPRTNWLTGPEYYDAAIVINGDGETVANHRKTHLYHPDETWALEGPDGFFSGYLHGMGPTAIGICTELNPYRPDGSWETFEFAHHVLDSGARVVVLPMAWTTDEEPRSFSQQPKEPDMQVLLYWVMRLEPVIHAESSEEVIVIFANPVGSEDGVTYAGTSAVIGIKDGEVRVYGILGRGDKELLIVDTEAQPYGNLIYRPDLPTAQGTDAPQASEPPKSRPEAVKADDVKDGKAVSDEKVDRLPKASPNLSSKSSKSSRSSKRGSNSQRPDLSVTIPKEDKSARSGKSRVIRTPTAPSPTPHSIRPRLTIPPVESYTQQYLEEQSLTTHRLSVPSAEPVKIYGGDITFVHTAPNSAVSPTQDADNYFSENSIESERLYWMPPQYQVRPNPLDPRWTPVGRAESTVASEASAPGRERRYSHRSDVAVWNSETGRPSTSSPRPNTDEIALLRETLKTHSPLRQPPSRPGTSPKFDKPLHQPPTSNARNSGRPRGQEQPQYDGFDSKDFGDISQGLQIMLQPPRSNTAFEDLDSESASEDVQNTQRKPRLATSMYTRQKQDLWDVYARKMKSPESDFREVIPIVMDPEVREVRTRPESSHSFRTQVPETKKTDPPILQTASQSRIPGRSNSASVRNAESSPTRSNIYRRNPVRSNVQAQDNRAVSRGRQPAPTEKSPKQAPGSHTGSRRGSRPDKGRTEEPIDLSQFNYIEEYPSETCAIHGSRPQSIDRYGSGRVSRHESVSASTRARGDSSGAATAYYTPSRNESKAGIPASSQSQNRSTSQSLSKSRIKDLDPNFRPGSAPIKDMPGMPPSRDKPPRRVLREVVIPSEPPLSRAEQGPKTPIAMVLVDATEVIADDALSSPGAPAGPMTEPLIQSAFKPRSAIW